MSLTPEYDPQLYGKYPRLLAGINLLHEYGLSQQGLPFQLEHEPLFQTIRSELETHRYNQTLLQPGRPNELLPHTRVIVIEIGGSKARIWLLHSINENSIDHTRDNNNHPIGFETTIPSSLKHAKNPEQFFQSIGSLLTPGLSTISDLQHPIHAIATIFSFAGDAYRNDDHVLIKPQPTMSKGFIVSGIEHTYVGYEVKKILEHFGVRLNDRHAIIDLNDGPATVLSKIGAQFGGIGGTGINHCIALPDTDGSTWLWNMETGNLPVPLTTPENIVNQLNPSIRGHHFSEMKTGGQRIIDVMNYIIDQMIAAHLLHLQKNDDLRGTHFSDLLRSNKSAFDTVFKKFHKRSDKESWWLLTEIALREWQNATYTEAMIILSAMQKHPSTFSNNHIYIPMDGTKFWETPLYRNMVQAIVESYLPPEKHIHFVKSSGVIGAAHAGLRAYKQQKR